MAISDEEWGNILRYYSNSTHATSSPTIPYCAFSTVSEDGSPRVAPYTSLILGDNRKGFYFDELSTQTSLNLERDQRVCILVVKTNKLFWIKTVFSEFPKISGSGTNTNQRAGLGCHANSTKRNSNNSPSTLIS